MHIYGRIDSVRTNGKKEVPKVMEWAQTNPEACKIIEKWYNILEFPKEFDAQFKQALKDIKISDTITIENFEETTDGRYNLLSFLYMCEELKTTYDDKKIPYEVLVDTLSDIVNWCNVWSGIKGELYLGECFWLEKHLSMQLFKLGRLQFRMGEARCDIPKFNISKGDNVLEIHIPEAGPLLPEECEKSVEYAKSFFATYFPEFDYKGITCNSWLLDKSLSAFLKPESNIIKFQNMFEEIRTEESDAILKYVFGDMDREKLKDKNPISSFSKKVKEHALSDGRFYVTLGVLK